MRLAVILTAILGLTSSISAYAAAASGPVGSYRMYLYFDDTKPFTDDLVLNVGPNGVTGVLHVPNDFDAAIENVQLNSLGRLSFHVKLPPKYDTAFPHGLDYVIQFESKYSSNGPLNFERFVGFVEQRQDQGPLAYVGSVVGFRVANTP